MSMCFTICSDCEYLMNHRVVNVCESCGSKNVYRDIDYSDFEVEDDNETNDD